MLPVSWNKKFVYAVKMQNSYHSFWISWHLNLIYGKLKSFKEATPQLELELDEILTFSLLKPGRHLPETNERRGLAKQKILLTIIFFLRADTNINVKKQKGFVKTLEWCWHNVNTIVCWGNVFEVSFFGYCENASMCCHSFVKILVGIM